MLIDGVHYEENWLHKFLRPVLNRKIIPEHFKVIGCIKLILFVLIKLNSIAYKLVV